MDRLHQELENAKREIEDWKRKFYEAQSAQSIIPTLENKINDLEDEKNKLKEQLNDSYWTVGQWKSKHIELEKKLTVISSLELTISGLQSEKDRKNNEIGDLQAQMNELKTRCSQLESKAHELLVLERQYGNLQQRQNDEEERFRRLQNEKESLYANLREREEAIKNSSIITSRRENELQDIIRGFEANISKMKNELADQTSSKMRLSEENKNLLIKISDLNKEISIMTELEQKLNAILREKELVEKKYGQTQADCESWKARYLKLKADFDMYMVDYDSMREKYDRLQIICDDHVKEIEKKAILIGKLQLKLVVVMSELERFVKGYV